MEDWTLQQAVFVANPMQHQWVELVGWSGGEAKASSVIFRLLLQSSSKVPPKSNVKQVKYKDA